MSALFRKIQRAEYTYPSWFTPQVRMEPIAPSRVHTVQASTQHPIISSSLYACVQVRRLLDKILIADPLKRASVADIEADPW